jgi:hypothetical protein
MVRKLHGYNGLRLITLNINLFEIAMLLGVVWANMHGYLRRSIAKSLWIVNATLRLKISSELATRQLLQKVYLIG